MRYTKFRRLFSEQVEKEFLVPTKPRQCVTRIISDIKNINTNRIETARIWTVLLRKVAMEFLVSLNNALSSRGSSFIWNMNGLLTPQSEMNIYNAKKIRICQGFSNKPHRCATSRNETNLLMNKWICDLIRIISKCIRY